MLTTFLLVQAAPPEPTPFFDTLESSLRDDYRLCTGDLRSLPMSELLLWKKQMDTFLEGSSFDTIVRQFYLETGLPAYSVRPCEIIIWYHNHEKNINDAVSLFAADVAARQKSAQDSLMIISLLKIAETTPFDCVGIPFGITKKALITMLHRVFTEPFSDEGTMIQYNRVIIDGISVKAAFHIDKNGYYRMYELESEGGPLDSLNSKVRLESAELAAFIETKTGLAPDHIFRIGRFDITQGRLAIERSWNHTPVSAFTGISTFKYHYYGKAIAVAHEITCVPDSLYQNSLTK
jgi:hypothetical protein